MSEPTPDERMATALHGLELLSHGSCQAWNASGANSGDPSGRIVTIILQADDPPHLTYRARYQRAFSDRAKLEIVVEAEAELKAWRKREKPAEVSISEEAVILADFMGSTPEEVAELRRVSPRFVRSTRARAGLGMEDGKPVLPERGLQPANRVEWAQALRDDGLSQEEIAVRMGVSQPTVSRLLGVRRLRRVA